VRRAFLTGLAFLVIGVGARDSGFGDRCRCAAHGGAVSVVVAALVGIGGNSAALVVAVAVESRSGVAVADSVDGFAVRRRMRALRPSYDDLSLWAGLRVPMSEFAYKLARVGWFTVWATCEDVKVAFGGPRTGKSGELAGRIIDAPGAVIATFDAHRSVNLTAQLRAGKGPVFVFNPSGVGGLWAPISVPLIPGQRPAQMCRQGRDRRDQGVLDLLRGEAVRKVSKQYVAGRPLDQGRDGRLVACTKDQVAFPVARDRPVGGLGRALADHQHRRLEAGAPLVRPALSLADGAAGAQALGQLATQLTAALDIQGLVDGLVSHVHLRLLGELQPQPLADLFRPPSSAKPVGDDLAQSRVDCELSLSRPSAAPSSAPLRRPWPILARARVGVAAQLTTDR
jgi:hypothetical protein